MSKQFRGVSDDVLEGAIKAATYRRDFLQSTLNDAQVWLNELVLEQRKRERLQELESSG